MDHKGYIKLWRKIQNNPLYKTKRRFSRNEAWIDLLLMATHKTHKIGVGLREIEIKRGQLLTSQLELSKRWKWGIASVKRFLNYLIREKQISYKAENKFTIITILNWEHYQGRTENKKEEKRKPNGKVSESKAENKTERKINPNGKQAERSAETKRKPKRKHTRRYKNEKNIQGEISPVKQVINFFKNIVLEEKSFKPEIAWKKESALIKRKLKNYSIEQLKDLIRWFVKSKKSKELGTTLSICLSSHIINLWLEDRQKQAWQYEK